MALMDQAGRALPFTRSGQHLADITLRVSPQAVITGRVVDEDGDPAPNIELQLPALQLIARANGSSSRGRIRAPTTWRVPSVRTVAREYYLSAMPAEGPRLYTGRQGYAPTYYPGASDPASAGTLELQPGTLLRGVEITLVKTRTVRLRGRVVDPSGPATMGVNVMLTPRADAEFMFERQLSANMDSQGGFEFPSVVPGAYLVQAFKHAGANKIYAATQAVDARGNDVENIVLELAPAAELKGYLRVEGRALANVADLQVYLQPDGPNYAGWPEDR